MRKHNEVRTPTELDILCSSVRDLSEAGNYTAAKEMIGNAMCRYPDAPHPHNLMGVVLEKLGDHGTAMKHFRAARALDPSYLPAGHNLDVYGTFFAGGRCAYDESDLPISNLHGSDITYNKRVIGHVITKNEIKYDEYGIGHVVRR